jgi:predicted transglutaminase-like cysteine proteinase
VRNLHFVAVASIVSILMASTITSASVPDPTSPRIGLGVTLWPSVAFRAKSAVPLGYYDLCSRGNPVCRQTSGRLPTTKSGAVRLSKALWTEVDRINASVNASMRFVNDSGDDRWRVGGAYGDCEDFALTKKSKLLAAGWPSSALVIALGKTRSGVGHAVLVVRTDQGDLVLDNLAPNVRPWARSLYRWQAVQSPSDTWTWYRI